VQTDTVYRRKAEVGVVDTRVAVGGRRKKREVLQELYIEIWTDQTLG
jgi:hypothetical protein